MIEKDLLSKHQQSSGFSCKGLNLIWIRSYLQLSLDAVKNLRTSVSSHLVCCSCPTASNEDKKDKDYDILHLLITSKVVNSDIDQKNKKKDDNVMINLHFERFFFLQL